MDPKDPKTGLLLRSRKLVLATSSKNKSDVMHWFCKPSARFRTHHLHLIPYESTLWEERIRFRDLLRTNQTVAKKYGLLKTELANKYKSDREAYTEKKTPFIQQVHMKEFDFTRFTYLGHRRLFRQFNLIESGPCCGPGMALAWSFAHFLKI